MAYQKVIVVGLDGLDPQITEGLLSAGELPHLARLREQGGYARLGTTCPAQTPVAWSTFATGVNPGGHGIFDFIGRDPQTYLPTLALNRYEQKNAFLPPQAINNRGGTPIWETLSNAGLNSVVLRHPCTFPPDKIRGQMLAGVGVPDLRGGLGTSTFYTQATDLKPQESENIIQVKFANNICKTHLIGPRNPKTKDSFEYPLTLQLQPEARRLSIRSDGQPGELLVSEGAWSNWLKVKIKTGALMSVRGLVRFYLRQLGPVFELYASPINFDPDLPLFPISAPDSYAGDLAARFGPFYTLGMAEEHGGITNGRLTEAAYLEQCRLVMQEREQMLFYELDRFKQGLLYCLFDTPDRLQHVFWRFREADHPANGPGDLTPELARVIDEHYRECDAIVGKVMQQVDDQTLLIVLSDHGMNSFRRGVHLNTWLYANGFLALQGNEKPGPDTRDFLRDIDWSRTQAYALGLGCIYLNLKGREAQGSVEPDDAARVKAAISAGLTGLVDVERGQVAVNGVADGAVIYRGPHMAAAPDLVVNFNLGYRVSWETPLGGVPAGLFADNTKKWSGDHVMDPALVPGVLFMNQPLAAHQPGLLDLAPTILGALGAPARTDLEGHSLLI